MNLIKTSFLNAISVLVRLVSLLALNKILAIYLGPAGYAAVGNFQNITQVFTTFTTGALSTGLTKLIAEYRSDQEKLQRITRTASSIVLIFCILAITCLFLFAESLAINFIGSAKYTSVFYWLGVALLFVSMNAILLAIVNGRNEVVIYVMANIAGSILALLITSLLVLNFQLYGALIGLSVFQAVTFFFTLFFCYRKAWFNVKDFSFCIDSFFAKSLSRFFIVGLASSLSIPVCSILIRSLILNRFGSYEAGIWEALNRLSGAYLLFVTTTLMIYFVPKVSAENNIGLIIVEIRKMLVFFIPCIFLLCLFVFFFRGSIGTILFSSDFVFESNIVFFQLLGDFFKVCAFIFSYCALGRGMLKIFLLGEVLSCIIWVVGSYYFAKQYGFVGVFISFSIAYAFYFLYMSIAVIKKLSTGGGV